MDRCTKVSNTGAATLSLAVLAMSVVRVGTAEAEDSKAPLGSEFIDMPDDQSAEAKPAAAPKDQKETPGYVSGYRRVPSLGLSPFSPQGYIAVPSVTPAFGAPSPLSGARFDFHGYMQIPVRAGLRSRPSAGPNQSSLNWHGDPLAVGGGYGWLDNVLVVPGPWAQLNFVYGNDVVQATAILGAWNISESMSAASYFQAPAQEWFHDAFLTYTPHTDPIGLKITAGVYPERYGAMAQYSNGLYGTPLIASVYGAGATATAIVPFEYDLDLKLEAGFKGDFNHPPAGLIANTSNDYAATAYGSTFVPHAHAALTWKNTATVGLHYIDAFSQDDRGDGVDDPGSQYPENVERRDGTLRIAGADLTVNGGRFGYLYFGGAKVTGRYTESISDIVQILNTGGGKQLSERFWGFQSKGNGALTLLGGQYTVSLGTLLRYPMEFWGEGPDLLVSLFGMYVHTTSDQPDHDGVNTYKAGTEVTYSIFPWFAFSTRIDGVMPDSAHTSESFAVISPKLIFRSDWQAREALTIQYATWILGDGAILHGDTRLLNVTTGANAGSSPSSVQCLQNGVNTCDKHMIAVYGTMWW